MIDICPLCGSEGATVFEHRARTPVLLNRTYLTHKEGKESKAGTLAMAGCSHCGFAWNQAFDPAMIYYDGAYENDQGHSAAFQAHLETVADKVLALEPHGKPIRLLEIGAGQAGFLKIVAKRAGPRLAQGWGFDTAWRGGSIALDGRIAMFGSYLDAQSAKDLAIDANVAVTRHTIEHVPDPLNFLRTIRSAMPLGSALVVETPCLEWIFQNQVFQDFFYEHCSLFTGETLSRAMMTAGFSDIRMSHVFGGQYLFAQARADVPEYRPSAEPNVLDFKNWAATSAARVAASQNALLKAHANGPVYVWGAGAKGVTFVSQCDPGLEIVKALVDANPLKQRRFAPVTGCPIIGPHAIQDSSPTILVMNPNYENEVRGTCSALNLRANFLSIQSIQ